MFRARSRLFDDDTPKHLYGEAGYVGAPDRLPRRQFRRRIAHGAQYTRYVVRVTATATALELPACVTYTPDVPARSRPIYLSPLGNFGPPCVSCALRPACPGVGGRAWDDALDEGLAPPELLVEPWSQPQEPPRLQSTTRRFGVGALAPDVAESVMPTRWLWTDRVDAGDETLDFTHLALELSGPAVPVAALLRIRALRQPVHVALRLSAHPIELRAVAHTLELAGVATLALLAGEGWAPAESALRLAFPSLDVRRVPPPRG